MRQGAALLLLPLIVLINTAISTQSALLNLVPVTTDSVGVLSGLQGRDIDQMTMLSFPFFINLSSVVTSARLKRPRNQRTQQPRTRIAYITYTFLGAPDKFKHLIFGALDTYMRNESTFFVVMTEQWQDDFETLCTDALYEAYCHRMTPIWVQCPEHYERPSPCCKMEKGLAQVFDAYQDEYDWFLFMDDDNYLRTAALHYYLSFLDPAEVIFVGTSEPRVLGNQYFDTPDYNCSSDDPQFQYVWAQPAIYSKAAMIRVVNGFRLGAMSSICMLYEVAHDVAAAIFGWMYSLPSLSTCLSMCGVANSATNQWMYDDRKSCFGCHGIANHRMQVIVDSMQLMQEYYEARENMEEWSVNKPDDCVYLWNNVTGFRQTRTYQLHNDPSTWVKWHKGPKRKEPDCLPATPSSKV
jgi:hypothetical protein